MSFTWTGNFTKAIGYLPFAQAQQRVNNRIGVIAQTLNPEQGVLILVKSHHIHIMAEGVNYFFTSRYNSETRHYLRSEPVTKIPFKLATKVENKDAVHSSGAPDTQRHIWYGTDGYSVASGFGTRYMTPAFPYSTMDKNGGVYGIAQVTVYKDGVKVYEPPIQAWTAFMIGNFVVAIGATGLWGYSKLGSNEVVDGGQLDLSIGSTLTDANFQPELWQPSNSETKLVFNRFEPRDTTGEAKHFSFNKHGTRGACVAHNIPDSYYDETRISDDVVIGEINNWQDYTAPELIELNISIIGDIGLETVSIEVIKMPWFYPEKDSTLLLADYYYPKFKPLLLK